MSLTISFKVKNYRCFSEENPLVFKIHNNSVTAFVGPNNAGKSAIFKFLYEFRYLWTSVINNWRAAAHGNGSIAFSPNVTDPYDLFSSYTKGDLSINVQINGYAKDKPCVSGFCFSRSRNGQTNFKVDTNNPNHSRFEIDKSNFHEIFNNTKTTGSVCSLAMVEAMSILAKALYIPAFRNTINQGASSYYDLSIGSAFIKQWKSWRVGDSAEYRNVIIQVTEQIKEILGLQSLEISANQSENNFFVKYKEGNQTKMRLITDMGSGISQLLLVLGNLAIKQPSLVLIDEPELNLHASLQLTFLQNIIRYSKNGVLMSTHSMGLARSASERIYLVNKKTGKPSVIKEYEKKNTVMEMAGELCFSSCLEMGFTRILLCEGPTEIKSIQHFLRLIGKDREVLLMSLGGSSLITKKWGDELAELKRFDVDIYVLIDSEKKSEDEDLSQDRADFAESCKKNGFTVHILERRAFENYLTTNAIQTVKSGKYSALEPYQLLKDHTCPWGKEENSKICSEMTLEDIEGTDLGEFLKSL